MDANSMNEEEEIQSPSVLKLKTAELENKLLLEKQRYILLQSELESSKLFASKHLDIYKNECMSLKEKMSVLENDNSLLKEKELKNQETIQNLLKNIGRVDKEYGSETEKNCRNLKKTERVDKEYGSETRKNCQNLKKNDNEVEEGSRDNAVENEGENTQVFLDSGSDSDDGMKYSPTLESKVNSESKTPSKKFKSSSDSILWDDGVSKDNHAQSGNAYTQSPGNTNIKTATSYSSKVCSERYKGRMPSSEQIDSALKRAKQLQKNIGNPSSVRPMYFSHLVDSCKFTLGKKFCMDNHLPRHDTEMILECEDGAIYEVYYTSWKYALSSRGWVNFSRRLHLEFGDVLVFELTGSTRLKVHVVKAIQEV